MKNHEDIRFMENREDTKVILYDLLERIEKLEAKIKTEKIYLGLGK